MESVPYSLQTPFPLTSEQVSGTDSKSLDNPMLPFNPLSLKSSHKLPSGENWESQSLGLGGPEKQMVKLTFYVWPNGKRSFLQKLLFAT